MVPDSEILLILVEALTALDLGSFTVKINHRKILDGIFDVCGVPADKTRQISSAVDKLDKSPWEEVRREMTVEKGLEAEIADRIGEYVKLKGERCMVGAAVLRRLAGARAHAHELAPLQAVESSSRSSPAMHGSPQTPGQWRV